MGLPKRVAYRREQTGDVSRDRAQLMAQKVAAAHEQTKGVVESFEASIDAINAANAASIAPSGGLFLLNKTVSSAGSSIAHTLGRVPIGYVITRVRSLTAAAPYTVGDNAAHTTTALNLIARCSTGGAQTITLDLYIF